MPVRKRPVSRPKSAAEIKHENDILAAARQLQPTDHSPEAEHLREVAGQIVDHREAARRRRR